MRVPPAVLSARRSAGYAPMRSLPTAISPNRSASYARTPAIGARKNATRRAMITARAAPRLAACVPRLAARWLFDQNKLAI